MEEALSDAVPQFSSDLIRLIAEFANPYHEYYRKQVMVQLLNSVPVFISKDEFVMKEEHLPFVRKLLSMADSRMHTRLINFMDYVWCWAYVRNDNTTEYIVQKKRNEKITQRERAVNLRKRKTDFGDLDHRAKHFRPSDTEHFIEIDEDNDILGMEDVSEDEHDEGCECEEFMF